MSMTPCPVCSMQYAVSGILVPPPFPQINTTTQHRHLFHTKVTYIPSLPSLRPDQNKPGQLSSISLVHPSPWFIPAPARPSSRNRIRECRAPEHLFLPEAGREAFGTGTAHGFFFFCGGGRGGGGGGDIDVVVGGGGGGGGEPSNQVLLHARYMPVIDYRRATIELATGTEPFVLWATAHPHGGCLSKEPPADLTRPTLMLSTDGQGKPVSPFMSRHFAAGPHGTGFCNTWVRQGRVPAPTWHSDKHHHPHHHRIDPVIHGNLGSEASPSHKLANIGSEALNLKALGDSSGFTERTALCCTAPDPDVEKGGCASG
ncbi:hypothetical protein AK830_g7719 [Neonectria ditissima]|uniref:Uncharacterized protein n=1 Tax=Neonectria ditissima TaxID=78410 RepID=A0A0N8H6F3_9HYPO|nr:hypothetical protein AK830_g7719 [Neonectria ditissima]